MGLKPDTNVEIVHANTAEVGRSCANCLGSSTALPLDTGFAMIWDRVAEVSRGHSMLLTDAERLNWGRHQQSAEIPI